MKRFIKKLFNIPTTTTVVMTAEQLADWLNEPVPTEAHKVFNWYSKNIPANDR